MKRKINKGIGHLPLAEGFFVWPKQTFCKVVVEICKLHRSPSQPESTQRPKIGTSSGVFFLRYNVQSKVRYETAQHALFKEKEANTSR